MGQKNTKFFDEWSLNDQNKFAKKYNVSVLNILRAMQHLEYCSKEYKVFIANKYRVPAEIVWARKFAKIKLSGGNIDLQNFKEKIDADNTEDIDTNEKRIEFASQVTGQQVQELKIYV